MVVLAVTGIFIGNPFLPVTGEATRHFVMGLVKSIHFWTANVFIVAVFARVLWMFAGNPYAKWHQFIPLSQRRLRGIWNTFGVLQLPAPGFRRLSSVTIPWPAWCTAWSSCCTS